MRASTLLACSMLLAAPMASASAEDRVIPVGDWSIYVQPSPGETPDPRCVAVAKRDPAVATFAMDNMARNESSPSKGSARLIFFVPDLISENSREVLKNITVRTSRGKVWAHLDAKWTRTDATGSLNTIVEDDVAIALEPISQASSLEVIVPQQTGEPKTYQVSLAGSAEALEEFKNCLATAR